MVVVVVGYAIMLGAAELLAAFGVLLSGGLVGAILTFLVNRKKPMADSAQALATLTTGYLSVLNEVQELQKLVRAAEQRADEAMESAAEAARSAQEAERRISLLTDHLREWERFGVGLVADWGVVRQREAPPLLPKASDVI